MTNFPEIDGLTFRRAVSIAGVDTSSITDGAASVASSVADSAESTVDSASAAVESTATKVDKQLKQWANELKSNLPDYYSVGLLGYCKGENENISCSDPSVSFSFNLSGIFNSMSSDIGSIVSGVDEKVLTGYRDVAHSTTWLYILALITSFMTGLLGVRKTFFQGGNKLLICSSIVSVEVHLYHLSCAH